MEQAEDLFDCPEGIALYHYDRNRSVIKHTKQHRYQEAPMHLKKYNLID